MARAKEESWPLELPSCSFLAHCPWHTAPTSSAGLTKMGRSTTAIPFPSDTNKEQRDSTPAARSRLLSARRQKRDWPERGREIESIRKAREDSLDEAAQSASAPTPAAPLASDSANICQEQLKKFLDSQACFAPYRLKDGGIKPEAFQRCTEVKEPRGCWQTPAPSDRNYMP